MQTLCRRYFIVRTAWLYGRNGNNFIRTMLRLAGGGQKIRVVDDQIGTPTNALDLSSHLLRLIVSDEYGIYHCANHGECSWFEFAKTIFDSKEISCDISPCSSLEYITSATRPAYSVLDNTMLELTIGDDMRTWQDALKDFISRENTVI